MTILLNGGSNPTEVFYNGTSLDRVIFNGVTVWERLSPGGEPTIISVVRAYSTSQGVYNIYLRNAQLTDEHYIYNQTTGKYYKVIEYSSNDCSFELNWPRYTWARYMYPTSDVSEMFVLSSDTDAFVTGTPSGFTFDSFNIETSETFNLDVKYSPNLSTDPAVIATYPTMQVIFRLQNFWDASSDDPGFMIRGVSTTHTTSTQLNTYMSTTGIIFQGSGKITFTREIGSMPSA